VLVDYAEKILNSYFALIPRFKPQNTKINQTLLIAHRGAHDNNLGIIENTLQAFKYAQEAGCWGIEFDIHFTADAVPVVNHDPTLNRLWGHDVAIAEVGFKELRTIEPGIPSLSEVVEQFGHMHLFIELKTPVVDEESVTGALNKLIPVNDFHLLTLDPANYHGLKKIPKQAQLLVAVHHNSKKLCQLSIKESYGGVVGSYLLLTNKKIRMLSDVNQVCGVGFVDSKNSLYREINRGVSWIFTNQAQKVGQELKNMQKIS